MKHVFLLWTAFAALHAACIAPDHAWMWRRSGTCGDAPFRDGVVELRHNDAQDWSLNCFPRMDVRPGDHFVFAFNSAKIDGPDGTIRPCVVTRRADGEVANWAYASVPVKPGEHGRTEFVVPYGASTRRRCAATRWASDSRTASWR